MNYSTSGTPDLANLIDHSRLASLCLSEAKQGIKSLSKAIQFFHAAYFADELTSDVVTDLSSEYGYDYHSKPIILQNGDVIKADDFITALQNQSDDDDIVFVTSIQGNDYSADEVFSNLDEQYVSNMCYYSAMNVLSNADNPDGAVDSSMYAANVPESVKKSPYYDVYYSYYASVMDMQNYNIEEKAEIINVAMTSSPDSSILDEFVIHCVDDNYKGLSPAMGWLVGQLISWVGTVNNVVDAIKASFSFISQSWKLLVRGIKMAWNKIRAQFQSDLFKESDGYQNLFDVPFCQYQFRWDQIIPGTFDLKHTTAYYPDSPSLNVKGTLTSLLYGLGFSLNDVKAWMGQNNRIEIPLKGVSYFITSIDSDTLLVQVFLGFVSSHGLSSYFDGTNLLTFRAEVPQPDSTSISLYQDVNYNISASDVENADAMISGGLAQYNLKSLDNLYYDLNVVEAEFSTDPDVIYGYMYNAAQLAYAYPFILSYCLNWQYGQGPILEYGYEQTVGDYMDMTDDVLNNVLRDEFLGMRVCIMARRQWLVGQSPAYYGFLSGALLTEPPYNWHNTMLPNYLPGNFYMMKKGLDTQSKTNRTAYQALNVGQVLGFPSQQSTWTMQLLCSSIIKGFIRYFIACNVPSESEPMVSFPVIFDSMHFPSYSYHVCTDAENVQKFRNFMIVTTGVVLTAAAIAIVAIITKGIGNMAVITRAGIYDNIVKLREATPGSAEYNKLLKEGRLLRRKMRRLNRIAHNTGASIDGLDLAIGNASSDIEKLIKLISG